ncbi:hypothetical protein CcrColossus_gp270 [Caulobacter phage CcrColossus]|uniref:Uncharacterized protein n=1 Tax=Caulobacter phage CcrColossus TaxID=1211640 RepID=K4JUV8_9CAUD|nr:hypothetical protein CcrColossus_gp270 [Caulobacter phage CcrColossus]AFU88140.1 hypothetical protein CcrColossus_gp270 [Caulobacter phage CcrColossus]
MGFADNMNDFQRTEMQSIKSRNMGGGGWTLKEFGHRVEAGRVIVHCKRVNIEKKSEHVLEYEIDTRGFSKVTLDAQGSITL